MSRETSQSGQLGFDALLAAAEEDNRKRRVARETAHLPATMSEALPLYRDMIARHDAAMRAADVDGVMALREEARRSPIKAAFV